jgi:hypothetical protein
MRNFISLSILLFFTTWSSYAMEDGLSTFIESIQPSPQEDQQENLNNPDNQSTLSDEELALLLSMPDEDTQPEDSTPITPTAPADISNDLLIAQLLFESEDQPPNAPPTVNVDSIDTLSTTLADTKLSEQTISSQSIHEHIEETINIQEHKPLLPIQFIEIPCNYIPVRNRLEEKTLFLISNQQEHFITEFKEICYRLSNTEMDKNVHVLDSYIFGPERQIEILASIGDALDLDNPGFSLHEIGEQMITFFSQNEDFSSSYEYEKYETVRGKKQQLLIKITPEMMKDYLQKHFDPMDAEVTNHSNAHVKSARVIWSRAFSLAFELYKFENDYSALKMLYDAAIEGHLTNGGCLAGRINRGFVLYISLLGKNGLGDI